MKTFKIACACVLVLVPFIPPMSAQAQWDEDGDIVAQPGDDRAEGYGTFEDNGDSEYYAEQLLAENQGGGMVMEEEEMPEGQGPLEGEVDEGYFYDKLAPHGEWIWTPEYGWVWRPNGVPDGWRPYTYGRWVYTSYGWTWVSYFDWGWAPFHYGSWAHLSPFGWVWVPGTVWAPAWVIWRYSDDYIGWSPMLAGFGLWFGWSFYPVIYEYWTFVPWGHFCDHHPHHHYAPRRSVASIFRHTSYPRKCRERSGPGCTHGPTSRFVEKRSGAPVKALRVDNLAGKLGRAKDIPRGSLRVTDDSVQIFRPKFSHPKQARPGLNVQPGRRVLDFGAAPGRSAPSSPSRPTMRPKTPVTPRPGEGKSIFTPRPKVQAPKFPAPKAWSPAPGSGRSSTHKMSPFTPSGQFHRSAPSGSKSSQPVYQRSGDRPSKPGAPSFKSFKSLAPAKSSSSHSGGLLHSGGSSHGSSTRHKR